MMVPGIQSSTFYDDESDSPGPDPGASHANSTTTVECYQQHSSEEDTRVNLDVDTVSLHSARSDTNLVVQSTSSNASRSKPKKKTVIV